MAPVQPDSSVDDPNWPELEPFRRAADEGRLLLKHCSKCGETHYYPRSICPFCHSGETHWLESRGLGAIYTYSIQRRVAEPFVIAYVTLDEGPTIMTHIVDAPVHENIHIGQRVQLVFRSLDGGRKVPMFRPIPEAIGARAQA